MSRRGCTGISEEVHQHETPGTKPSPHRDGASRTAILGRQSGRRVFAPSPQNHEAKQGFFRVV